MNLDGEFIGDEALYIMVKTTTLCIGLGSSIKTKHICNITADDVLMHGDIECNIMLLRMNTLSITSKDLHVWSKLSIKFQDKEAPILLNNGDISMLRYAPKSSDKVEKECMLVLDQSKMTLAMQHYQITCTSQIDDCKLNVMNITNVQMDHCKIECFDICIQHVQSMECNNESTIDCIHLFECNEMDDFKLVKSALIMKENQTIINVNNSFCMESDSLISAHFEYFEIRCDDGMVHIAGELNIKKYCLFKIFASDIVMAASAKLTSELAYINKDKSKELKAIVPPLTEHNLVHDTAQILNTINDHHIHLSATNTMTFFGTIHAKHSLVILDSVNHICMEHNSTIRAQDTLLRCLNTITIEGRILTESGNCVVGANDKLCVTKHAEIDVVILKMYGDPKDIDEDANITAENMDFDAIMDKLKVIDDEIAAFEATRESEMFDVRTKRDEARDKLDREVKKITDTVEITGLNMKTILPFLKSMSKLPDITMQQKEHLVLLNEKLKSFVMLIEREFNYKMDMKTYLEAKNLGKYYAQLLKAGFKELEDLKCQNENEFESKVLIHVKNIKARAKTKLRDICVYPEKTWGKSQAEKARILLKALETTTPMLSSFFEEMHGIMQHKQQDALEFIKNNGKANTRTVKQNDDEMKTSGLNVVVALREKYKSDADTILKKKAFNVIKGVEHCCDKMIDHQRQMDQSVVLLADILKAKPEQFKIDSDDTMLRKRITKAIADYIKKQPQVTHHHSPAKLSHSRPNRERITLPNPRYKYGPTLAITHKTVDLPSPSIEPRTKPHQNYFNDNVEDSTQGELDKMIVLKRGPVFHKLKKLCMRELAEGKGGWITNQDDSDTEVPIEIHFTGALAPLVTYLKDADYDEMDYLLCEHEDDFETILGVIKEGMETDKGMAPKRGTTYDDSLANTTHSSLSKKRTTSQDPTLVITHKTMNMSPSSKKRKPRPHRSSCNGSEDLEKLIIQKRGPVFEKLKKLCMREIAEGEGGWITNQDDSDTEVPIETYFTDTLAPFVKYLTDADYDEMDYLLCEHEDDFETILGVIKKGIAEDKGNASKRRTSGQEDSVVRTPLTMADDEDVQASSNSSHSSPNQKLTDSGAKDEKQEEFDQMTPRATTTMHDEDVQSSCSSLHSSPNQKRTVSLDPRYNDSKAKPHLSHSNLEKPNNNLDKPSKTSEQEGSMVQTPRAMGTIYDDDDANEDVRIQDAAIDTVSKRLLSKLSQRPSIDVAMARGILLFRVDTKIDYNLQSRYQQLRRRKVAQHLEQMILSRRQTRMELEPERRMSSDPTQVEASAWFFGVSPITLSPQVITPRNNAYINAMLRTIESLHASSTDIHTKKRKRTTLQSYSDDDNEEDEWQEEEELEKMIIQKRGHVFQKLKKLCMRELAEGEGGWITNQDDSDTEVPIETYFTGALAPLVKYLKDVDYDEMDYLLCEHDEDFETILGVIKKGMADDKGIAPPRKEDSIATTYDDDDTNEEVEASSNPIHSRLSARDERTASLDPHHTGDPKLTIIHKSARKHDELEKMIIEKRDPVFNKLKQLCMRELAEGKGGWITNQDDSDTEVPIEIYFTGTLVPLIKYLKDADYDEMDYLLCEHDEDFDTILGVIKKGMADDKGKVPKRETPKEDSEVRPPHAITTTHDDEDVEASSSSVHSSPHHAARQSAITPKTVDLSSPSAQRKAKPHQSDSNDAEEDEKHEQLMKMIIEKRGHVFKKLLCEHDDDFQTILGVITKGMADDKGMASKRETPKEDNEVRTPHVIATIHDEDVKASSSSMHSSPHPADPQSSITAGTVDLSSSSTQRKPKPQSDSNDYEEEEKNEELEKMIIGKRGPVFKKLKQLCMRELAEGKGGWITNQNDSDTEVPIEIYFTGALVPLIKYLKGADYDEMDYVLCEHDDDFETILGVIKQGMASDKLTRRTSGHRDSVVKTAHAMTTIYDDDDANENVQSSSDTSHQIPTIPNPKRTASDLEEKHEELERITPHAMQTIHDDDVQTHDPTLSIALNTIRLSSPSKKRKAKPYQSYSNDDHKEDGNHDELEKMIIEKRGTVFKKLRKLCMREVAEGKGGWITTQDDSDTEVPIERYFTGALAPMIKYLKDADYDEMDCLLCAHEDDFETILGVIKKGMADDKGKVSKRETPHAITTIHDDVNDVEASSSSVHSSPHHAAPQSSITPKTIDLSSPSAQRKAKPHQSDSNDAEEDEKHEELMKMIIEKRGHVFKKLKQLCMRELAEGEGGWITNQDASDTEVPIETHFTGALAPLVKYLKDADYDEMDYVLCEHEDDFETILGVIKKGMADDKGNTSRNEDSEVRALHPITTTYDDDANGDIESSSNPTHPSPSQKPSASLDLSVDSASKKRKTKQHQSSSNDANNPTYEELEKMMIHKRGPVFNKLKKLCMRELAEGKGGWITNQDDSDTEMPIETYFTGALAHLIKYLKDADYDEMDYLLCEHEDDFETILDVIKKGMAADNLYDDDASDDVNTDVKTARRDGHVIAMLGSSVNDKSLKLRALRNQQNKSKKGSKSKSKKGTKSKSRKDTKSKSRKHTRSGKDRKPKSKKDMYTTSKSTRKHTTSKSRKHTTSKSRKDFKSHSRKGIKSKSRKKTKSKSRKGAKYRPRGPPPTRPLPPLPKRKKQKKIKKSKSGKGTKPTSNQLQIPQAKEKKFEFDSTMILLFTHLYRRNHNQYEIESFKNWIADNEYDIEWVKNDIQLEKKGTTTKVTTAVSDVATKVTTAVGDAATKVTTAIGDTATNIVSGVGSALGAVGGFFGFGKKNKKKKETKKKSVNAKGMTLNQMKSTAASHANVQSGVPQPHAPITGALPAYGPPKSARSQRGSAQRRVPIASALPAYGPLQSAPSHPRTNTAGLPGISKPRAPRSGSKPRAPVTAPLPAYRSTQAAKSHAPLRAPTTAGLLVNVPPQSAISQRGPMAQPHAQAQTTTYQPTVPSAPGHMVGNVANTATGPNATRDGSNATKSEKDTNQNTDNWVPFGSGTAANVMHNTTAATTKPNATQSMQSDAHNGTEDMETSETTQNSADAIKSEMDTRDDSNQDLDNSMNSELFAHVDAAMDLDSMAYGPPKYVTCPSQASRRRAPIAAALPVYKHHRSVSTQPLATTAGLPAISKPRAAQSGSLPRAPITATLPVYGSDQAAKSHTPAQSRAKKDTMDQLQSLQFPQHYVDSAFKIYEEYHGHSYNTQAMIEIIVGLQTKDKKKAISPHRAPITAGLPTQSATSQRGPIAQAQNTAYHQSTVPSAPTHMVGNDVINTATRPNATRHGSNTAKSEKDTLNIMNIMFNDATQADTNQGTDNWVQFDSDTTANVRQNANTAMVTNTKSHDIMQSRGHNLTGKSTLEMNGTQPRAQHLGTLLPSPKTGKKNKNSNTDQKTKVKKPKNRSKNVIQTNYSKMYRDIKAFVKSLNAEPLWKVVDNGVVNVVTSDAVAIHISLNYFSYFGQFKHSLNELHDLQTLKRLLADINAFEDVRKNFEDTMTKMEKKALESVAECLKETPSAEVFEKAQKNRKKYATKYQTALRNFTDKEKELDNAYNTLYGQRCVLLALKASIDNPLDAETLVTVPSNDEAPSDKEEMKSDD